MARFRSKMSRSSTPCPRLVRVALQPEVLEERALLSVSTGDPTVAIPAAMLGSRGQTVNLPVSITDNASGLLSADLNMTYSPGSITLGNSDVALSGYLQSQDWGIAKNVNPATGMIRTSMYATDMGPLPTGTPQLLNLQFTVAANAPAGVYPVHIVTAPTTWNGSPIPASRLNEGQLALSTSDGSIRVPIDAVIAAPASGSEGSAVNLTGSMQDAFDDVNPVRYNWIVSDSSNQVIASDTNDPSPTFSFTPIEEDTYSVSLTIKDATDPTEIYGSTTTAVLVTEPDILGSSASLPTISEGDPSAVVQVGSFTHASGVEPATDFAATVNWGPGHVQDPATVTRNNDGTYTVTALRPVYSEESLGYTVVVFVQEDSKATLINDTQTVIEPAIVPTPATLAQISEGTAAADIDVATFTHAGGVEDPSQFSATVDWGRGPVSADAVTEDASHMYHVTATRPVFVEEGNYPVTVKISDNDGPAVTQQVNDSLVVSDAALTITNLSPPNAAEGISTGTITVATFTDAAGSSSEIEDFSATIAWGDGVTEPGAIVATMSPGVYQVQGSHTYPTEATGLTFTVSLIDGDGGANDSQSTIINVAHTTFRVTNFAHNASGFDVTFNRAADLTVLNLYSGQNMGTLAPDLTLVGDNVGTVKGSLVWDAATNTATFVKTGGPLLADTYHLTLDSRSDGFKDARAGELLDGNADGTVGDDYTNLFTIADYSNSRVVNLPDFARGPGQSVDFSNSVLGAAGLPIQISDGTGVIRANLQVDYNSSLLTISGVSLAAGMPGDWAIDTTGSTDGHFVIHGRGTTALGAGQHNLFTLAAAVPSEALYGASEEVRLSSVSINGGAIGAVADESMDKTAFLGDATGDQSYSSMDASLIARVVVGLDSGFDHYPLTDPIVIGDVTADGTLSGLDASYVAREVVDPGDNPIIPAFPPGFSANANPSASIDPTVTIPLSFATPGGTVTVPINVNEVNGLQGVDLAFSYPSSIVNIANADIALSGNMAADGWSLTRNLNTPGLIRLSMYGLNPISATGPDSLLTLKFHVPISTVGGSYPVSVITNPINPSTTDPSRLNEGQLTLSTQNGVIVVADPLTVVNTNDSGPGSLRQVIIYSNGLPGAMQTITFAIPAGPQTINLLTPLPASIVPLVVQLDGSQDVIVVSPTGGGQDNYSDLTKVGAGRLTIAGANNLTGGVEISNGTLGFNVSTAPTLPVAFTPLVDGTGTLQLAGSVSALSGGASGNNVTNNSTAAAGVLVSGTNQFAGDIDGTGTLTVGDDGQLTANHVVQGALVIGGSAGHPATLTIAASDATGSPLAAASDPLTSSSQSAALAAPGGSVDAAAAPAVAPADIVSTGGTASSIALTSRVTSGAAAALEPVQSEVSATSRSLKIGSPSSSGTVAISGLAFNEGSATATDWSTSITFLATASSQASALNVGQSAAPMSAKGSLDPDAVAAAFDDSDVLEWIASSRGWQSSSDSVSDTVSSLDHGDASLLADELLEAIGQDWQV
jgi:autotransporter-associated beta strand protein